VAQDYAASVQGVAIRVTRLNSDLTLENFGTTEEVVSYTTSAFIRVSFTPEYEEGDEITQKAADGTVCVSFKAPDTLKRVNLELAICEPDPELTHMLSGGLLLTKDYTIGTATVNQAVGWSSPDIGEDPSLNGVAIEVWSQAIQSGKRAATRPYFHWIFPYVKVRPSGDRVIENGLLANTFEGFGLGNDQFGTGPDGLWEWPLATERAYSYARSNDAPTGYKGLHNWDPADASATTLTGLTDPGAGFNTDPAEGTIDYVYASEEAAEAP
jgi:hypothetical protein